MESLVEQNKNRIQELEEIKEESDLGDEVKTLMQEQINNMLNENERLQQLAQEEKKKNGILGWLFN